MKMFSVTQILAPHSGYDEVPQHWLIAAQARGTSVHSYCTAYAMNLWPEPLPEAYRGYGISFTRWFDLYVEEAVFSEERLEDPVLGFCGHPDLVVRMKYANSKADPGGKHPTVQGTIGINRLLDVKTAAQEQITWKLQLSAYWHLLRKRGIEIHEAGCLMLDRDGGLPTYVPHPSFIRDFAVFYGLLQGHHYLYDEED